jgi:hypothetical protein
MPYQCGFSDVADHQIRVSPRVLSIVVLATDESDQHQPGGYLMSYNEFRRPVSVDFAPRGSLCEWCGKPAERQLTAIGGSYHNESGLFCRSCGEEFTRAVINSLNAASADASAHSL